MLTVHQPELGSGVFSLLLIQELGRGVGASSKIAIFGRGRRHDAAALVIRDAVAQALSRRSCIGDLERVPVVGPSYRMVTPLKRVVVANLLGVPAAHRERKEKKAQRRAHGVIARTGDRRVAVTSPQVRVLCSSS